MADKQNYSKNLDINVGDTETHNLQHYFLNASKSIGVGGPTTTFDFRNSMIENFTGGSGATTTLSSVGNGASVVSNGDGPDLTVRSFLNGIGITANENDPDNGVLYFNNVTDLQNVGAGQDLVVNPSPPHYTIKGIVASVGLVASSNSTDVLLANNTTAQSTGTGSGIGMVSNPNPPIYSIKRISSADGSVTLTDDTTNNRVDLHVPPIPTVYTKVQYALVGSGCVSGSPLMCYLTLLKFGTFVTGSITPSNSQPGDGYVVFSEDVLRLTPQTGTLDASYFPAIGGADLTIPACIFYSRTSVPSNNEWPCQLSIGPAASSLVFGFYTPDAIVSDAGSQMFPTPGFIAVQNIALAWSLDAT